MKSLSLGLVCLLVCQCAYQIGHGDRRLPGEHKTIFVEVFRNRTDEPGIETFFTQALMNELERSGFVVVTSKNSAEVILQGSVLSITTQGQLPKSQFRDARDARYHTTYKVIINSNMRLIRSRDKKVIWQTNLRGDEIYRGGLLTQKQVRASNVLYNQSRKTQTIKKIAGAMMREVFDRLTENF